MRRPLACSLVLLIASVLTCPLQAARVASDVLIEVQPEKTLSASQQEGYRKLRNQDPSIKWIMPASVDPALMDRDRFSLELYGQTLQVVRTSDPGLIDSFGQRRWRGYILEGGKFDELTSVGLSLTRDGKIYGSVRSLEWHYQVVSQKAGPAVIVAHRLSEMDADTSGDVPPASEWPSMDPQSSRVAPQGVDDLDVIRVVVGFTAASEVPSQADFLELVGDAIQTANDIFASSNIALQIELAAFARPNYPESSTNQAYSDLLLGGSGPLWLVNVARVNELADVAYMITRPNSGGPCGLATPGPSGPAAAVSALRSTCLTSYVLAHELGHILKANHNVENEDGPLFYPWAHAFRYTKANRLERSFSTLMDLSPPTHPRIQRVSSPSLTYNGVTIGDADARDNRRVIMENKSIVADFYPDPATLNGDSTPLYTQGGILEVAH